jgi:hypothetical protein
MTKQEFLRVNQVNQMPRLVQVMAGRIYDAAFEAGRAEGFRQGVDAVALKEQEIHKRMYDEGAKDANHFGSALFTAAACCVMHDYSGWGRIRLKRLCDRIGHLLTTELTPTRLIERCASFGIKIDYADELTGQLDGWEETA